MNEKQHDYDTIEKAIPEYKEFAGLLNNLVKAIPENNSTDSVVRKYHNITKDDMLNGDGLRVVLWMSGCEHHCKGCHNPITWDPEDGLEFTEETKKELFDELDKDYIAGITFSGGDPLATYNVKFTKKLICDIRDKYPKKTIWVYTGYTLEELLKKEDPAYTDILFLIDVLVDGKFIEDKKDNKLLWKGSSNQRVIDMPSTNAKIIDGKMWSLNKYIREENLVQYLQNYTVKESDIVLHCGDHEKDPSNVTKCRGCE